MNGQDRFRMRIRCRLNSNHSSTMVFVPFAQAFRCERRMRFARAAEPDAAIDIGSRRELFVDDFLIARTDGVKLKLHQPFFTRPPPEKPRRRYDRP